MVWLGVLIFILLVFLAFSAFVAYKMVKPPRFVGDWTPEDLGFDYEDVEFTTEDGLKLSGWWVDRGSDKTVLPLHGYTRSRWDEVYMKDTIEFLLKEGYNVLVFDFRAHGKSEGKYTTVGDRELLDVKAAVAWLRENHPERAQIIALVGFSMGGIVTIRALAELKEVCCGVADSPPIYLDKTGARGLKYFANLPEWLYYFVKPFTKLFSGARELNMLEYADKVERPLLFIAGEKDPLVKVDEVKEFYELNKKRNPDVELWVTDAPHVRALKLHPKEWKGKVGEFLKKYL
ncbi:alpha/beta hydrolase [Thermococcus thioreducens]|uniref:Alpha/beta hydrolase n=1 Tax=Thermococcus thioreducens TaxID=277988 RepID=A0A0Q2QRX4_9EURY|nr:alpha/beta hydrolase [Thermococcus thioreducens]ASJ12012.1 alpha/beta hydrolase [Thermococcus thioreducens]KQH82765.1 alpha/beta hydrolase [Thermococcus thioreducens]SEW10045.1 X-Pro dipeptidyl-peptidase (S15 family) [Thermococcus thioreducens]